MSTLGERNCLEMLFVEEEFKLTVVMIIFLFFLFSGAVLGVLFKFFNDYMHLKLRSGM